MAGAVLVGAGGGGAGVFGGGVFGGGVGAGGGASVISTASTVFSVMRTTLRALSASSAETRTRGAASCEVECDDEEEAIVDGGNRVSPFGAIRAFAESVRGFAGPATRAIAR